MASYPPPNSQNGSIFNPSDWIAGNAGGIDTAYLNQHYCQFPVAQGNMSFAGISNTGTTTIGQNLVMQGIYNTNYLEFPDGTKQYTAVAGSDILNTNNTFYGVNNFFPPTQAFGSTLNEGLTFTNNQYINGSGDTDIIAYIPNTTTGLCIFALTTNSASFATPQIQLLPDGTASNFQASAVNGIVSIISNNTGGTIQLKSDAGVQLVHNASLKFSTYGNLTGGSTGLSSSVNFTSPSITTPSITQTTDDTDITITCSGLNSNVIINSTAGLLLKSNPVILFGGYGTLTGSPTGLTSSVSLFVPTQTAYNSGTPYGDSTATQAFVQSAINSGGSGDVSLAGNNLFTGFNNFYNNFAGVQQTNRGLTIGANMTNSAKEVDIICINPLTTRGLSIYAQSTAVSDSTPAKIIVYNDGSPTVFTTAITLPSQTAFSGTSSYGNLAATQNFVQTAIDSIGGGGGGGGGDVYLAATNPFTGINTFNSNVPSTTISQTFPSAATQNFATIGYVNSIFNTINCTFTAASYVEPTLGSPNYMTAYIMGTTLWYSGSVQFFGYGSAPKFTFGFSPSLPYTVISNFQNASLINQSYSNQYTSISTSSGFTSSAAGNAFNIILNTPSPASATCLYTFNFSGITVIQ